MTVVPEYKKQGQKEIRKENKKIGKKEMKVMKNEEKEEMVKKKEEDREDITRKKEKENKENEISDEEIIKMARRRRKQPSILDVYRNIDIRHRNVGRVENKMENSSKKNEGRVTSHLTGLFYRNINLLNNKIKPIYVLDGKPPELKSILIQKRREIREKNQETPKVRKFAASIQNYKNYGANFTGSYFSRPNYSPRHKISPLRPAKKGPAKS